MFQFAYVFIDMVILNQSMKPFSILYFIYDIINIRCEKVNFYFDSMN